MSEEFDEATPKRNGEVLSIKKTDVLPNHRGFNIAEKKHLDVACRLIEIKYGLGTGENYRLVPRKFYRRKITDSGQEYYESTSEDR